MVRQADSTAEPPKPRTGHDENGEANVRTVPEEPARGKKKLHACLADADADDCRAETAHSSARGRQAPRLPSCSFRATPRDV